MKKLCFFVFFDKSLISPKLYLSYDLHRSRDAMGGVLEESITILPMLLDPIGSNGRVENLPPPKWRKSKSLVCLGVASSGLCHFLGLASSELHNFWGWQVQDSAISGSWYIGKLLGGKKNETPCRCIFGWLEYLST